MIELVLADRAMTQEFAHVPPRLKASDVLRVGATALGLTAIVGLAHHVFGASSDYQWVHWTFLGLALDTGLGVLSQLFRPVRSDSLWRQGMIIAALQIHILELAILPGGDLAAAFGWYGAMIIATGLSLSAAQWLRRPMMIASLAALSLCALIAPPPALCFEWTPVFFFSKIMMMVSLKTHFSNPTAANR